MTMDNLSATILILCLLSYVAGAAGGLVFLRCEKVANFVAFGFGSLAALCGAIFCVASLATGAPGSNQSIELLPRLIPYLRFTIRPDALSLFFTMIVSVLGL